MNLKIIFTLGMGGRELQKPIKRCQALMRPPMFKRGTEKATLKVLRRFYTEPEADFYIQRIGGSSSSWWYFESEQFRKKFLKALVKAGWDAYISSESERCKVLFQDGKWVNVAPGSFISNSGEMVSEFDLYRDDDGVLRSDSDQSPVEPIGELTDKEILKRVKKRAA